MNTNFKIKRWQSKKYRDGAKDQPCTMRLPCCNYNNETTVLCHQNGAGVAMKSDDFNAADMCSACHDVFDGRVYLGERYNKNRLFLEFTAARYETIINRIVRGILK